MGDGSRQIVQAQLACVDRSKISRRELRSSVADPQFGGAEGDGGAGDGGEMGVEVEGKKKRGRSNKGSGVAVAAAPKRSKKEEEDVCFICFDGGKLVLCDRRDCPKAYHPACVKRDEAFFSKRLRWNCGWHLCNNCQRNALFMCYTCPYSLCKGCVKQADISCVRGNKGFCRTCMTTILLIENVTQGQVDFDDKTSWEYLFKVYWILLKQKESLTIEELTQATNLWKRSGLDNKDEKLHDPSVSQITEVNNRTMQSVESASKRRKTRKQPQGLPVLNKEPQMVEEVNSGKGQGLHGGADWASKELLEFVAHMKNGDMSVLSQFDVQTLLLEYIKNNNLRDPRRKCQIICDRRLENLFGKSRLGHFEMLKLLEYHFKEDSRANGVVQGAILDPLAGQGEAGGSCNEIQTRSRERKRQIHKKGDGKGRETNQDSYAAIDLHNINLIYLKRELMENLMEDNEKFHDKVVGSIVRIRISCNDQKQDMYRLVRVIGTSKVSELYKIGDKTANIKLKILNLNNIEDVAIDAISNQEFSEDDCKRLRESIKLGLVERITVGEIQEKAIALQSVRVNDCLEEEIMKLNHLRDRASEMGHRKELRELVEKIEFLKTPEERQRRLCEIPEVHVDPRMHPSYGSDDDSEESNVRKQDESKLLKHLNAKGNGFISPRRGGDTAISTRARVLRSSASNMRNTAGKIQAGIEGAHESSRKSDIADAAFRVLEQLRDPADSVNETSNRSVTSSGSFRPAASNGSVTSFALSDNSELDKIWHYQDPSGKIQGPFCKLQLRKWNSSGYFPTDLRVWKIAETQDQSILLADVLTGQLNNAASSDNKPNSEGSNSNLTPAIPGSNCEKLLVNGASGGNEPSSNCEKLLVNGASSGNEGNILDGLDQSSDRNEKDRAIENSIDCGCPTSGAATAVRSSEIMDLNSKAESFDLPSSVHKSENNDSRMENEHSSTYNVPGQNSGTGCTIVSGGIELPDLPSPSPKREHEDLECQTTQTEQFKHPHISECDGTKLSHVPSPTPNAGSDGAKSHVIKDKQSVVSGIPGQDSATNWDTVSRVINELFDLSTEPAKSESEGLKAHEMEHKHSIASNVPVQDSVSSWTSISGGFDLSNIPSNVQKPNTSVVKSVTMSIPAPDSVISWGSMVRLPDFDGEWGGYSLTQAKPSVQELDFGLVSGSSAKQTEGFSDHAMHSSPNHPGSHTSGWQPIELSTLGDDLVSDLLSQVEAMESLRGMPSPSSRINCGDDSIDSPGDDCFPLAGLSPHLDHGRNDAFSSTADVHFHGQATVRDQTRGLLPVHVHDPTKMSSGLELPLQHDASLAYPTSIHQEGEFNLTYVSMHQQEIVPQSHHLSAPTSTSMNSEDVNNPWRPEPENAHLHSSSSFPATSMSLCDETGGDGEFKESFVLMLQQEVSPESREPSSQPTPSMNVVSADTDWSPDARTERMGWQTVQENVNLSSPSSLPPASLDTSGSPRKVVPQSHQPPATSLVSADARRPQPEPAKKSSSLKSPRGVSVNRSLSRREEGEVKRTTSPVSVKPTTSPVSTDTRKPRLDPARTGSDPLQEHKNHPSALQPRPPRPPQTTGLKHPASPEEEGEVNPSDLSAHQQVSVHKSRRPSTLTKTSTNVAAANSPSKPAQENAHSPRVGPSQSHWSSSQGGANAGNSVTNPGIRGSQTRYSSTNLVRHSHSHPGPRDYGHHQGRLSSWNRLPPYGGGGGGGGGSARAPPPHSQRARVCKFYESGHCKRGASCKYLHP